MRTLKTFLGIALFVTAFYSCEPEELPADMTAKDQAVTQDTGDKEDEWDSRKDG